MIIITAYVEAPYIEKGTYRYIDPGYIIIVTDGMTKPGISNGMKLEKVPRQRIQEGTNDHTYINTSKIIVYLVCMCVYTKTVSLFIKIMYFQK